MDSLVKRFISQKFGRGIGKLTVMDEHCSVLIEFVDPARRPRRFELKKVNWDAFDTTQVVVLENVLRVAIARLHRTAWPETDAIEPLNQDGAPWIGDFDTSDNTGGTLRFPRWTAGRAERREARPEFDAVIQNGIKIFEEEGRPAARYYLRSAGVPPSVIRRILANRWVRRRSSEAT